jgi:predicted nucleic acid-binding protein
VTFVVADTSFLIDAMERAASRSRDRLTELLAAVADGSVTMVVPAPVVAELCRGANHDPQLAEQYDALLSAAQVTGLDEAGTRDASVLAIGADLRGAARAERPGIVDAMVAQAAEAMNAELLTTDPHFRLFAGVRVTVLAES